MIRDNNKEIAEIIYNHLNLPKQIVFENSNSIEYSYNAAGVKLKKTVVEETANPEVRKEVDYLDGFQYAGEMLNFFPTAEGYVRATPVGNIAPGSPPTGYAYSYVYNYTDHLGNVRLSYSMDHLTGKLKILEENHYYPFGLRHEVHYPSSRIRDFRAAEGLGGGHVGDPVELVNVTKTEYMYKYNGKELQDELGLNFYDYGARNYDPAIGRWMNVDPLAELSRKNSPYVYALNNPIFYIDPDGMMASPIVDTEGNLLGTDSEGWTGETIVMDKEDFTQGMDHSEALDKGTELSNYEEGIKITDKTWNTIEKNGGEKMTPYLSNQSDSEVYYKPESGDKNDCAIRVDAGKDVYAPVDGVATSKYSDSVLKIPTGSTITITSEGGGDIDFYGLGGLIRMHPEYGWIKKNIITDKYPNDTSWNELFFQASQIGEKKY